MRIEESATVKVESMKAFEEFAKSEPEDLIELSKQGYLRYFWAKTSAAWKLDSRTTASKRSCRRRG